MHLSTGTQKQLPDQRQESTTTRVTGGLDYSAKDGKRQGREVPQSLRTTQIKLWTRVQNARFG